MVQEHREIHFYRGVPANKNTASLSTQTYVCRCKTGTTFMNGYSMAHNEYTYSCTIIASCTFRTLVTFSTLKNRGEIAKIAQIKILMLSCNIVVRGGRSLKEPIYSSWNAIHLHRCKTSTAQASQIIFTLVSSRGMHV